MIYSRYLILYIFTILFCFHAQNTYASKIYEKDWALSIKNLEITATLSTVENVLEYGGSYREEVHFKEAEKAFVFYILELEILKSKAGVKAFDWAKLYIIDENENKFFRMKDDTFLREHAYRRLNGVELQMSRNKGYVCFELPQSSINKELFLVYEDENSQTKITILHKM